MLRPTSLDTRRAGARPALGGIVAACAGEQDAGIVPGFYSGKETGMCALCARPILAALCGLVLGTATLYAVPAEDGLYATFETSLGTFVCRLAFEDVPRTTANFVGLADGSRAWVDLRTGHVVARPFYEGLIFHRVIDGFVIQGGSPHGDGSDGPGYTFPDEFHPDWLHDAAGVLSMANSGLNSNGSQFFVTLGPKPQLDYLHSVFGEVVEGMPVVQAIGAVGTDDDDKPLTDVTIERVTITRIGAAAEAFDVTAHDLPIARGTDLRWLRNASATLLRFERVRNGEYRLFEGEPAATWSQAARQLFIGDPPEGGSDVTASVAAAASRCYRVSEVVYAGPLYTHPIIDGAVLTLNLVNLPPPWFLELSFDAGNGGAWRLNGSSPGVILARRWTQEAYRGVLVAMFDALPPLRVSLEFGNGPTGVFYGTFLDEPDSTTVFGPFLYVPPTGE